MIQTAQELDARPEGDTHASHTLWQAPLAALRSSGSGTRDRHHDHLAGSGVGGIFNLGQANTVDQQTQLTGTTNGNPQLRVENASTAANSFGIFGRMSSGSAGVDSAGVRGVNASSGANGFGVIGIHNAGGVGVAGQAGSGTGVLGTHTGSGGTDPGVEGHNPSEFGGAAGVVAAGPTGLVACTPVDLGCPRVPNLPQIAGWFQSRAANGVGILSCGGISCGELEQPPGGVGGEFNSGLGGKGVLVNGGTTGGRFRAFDAGGIGVSSEAKGTNGTGAAGIANSGASAVGILGQSTTGLAGRFEGNVHVTGRLTRAYTAGTSNQATPIAYGDVTGGGSTVTTSSTPNVTSTFDSVNKRYVITIAGESYDINHFATTVTPINTAPRFVATQSSGGTLLVRIFDLSGTPVQSPFDFVTFKP